ncbi:hypothetical protein [Dyadobacter psychrotolerans]|uniref:Uncharacterized protein n=1 Tax=Dyadobacter psychrotolerans TaxID=2541721 RepID=A0A4R5DQU8_9BACT|nr:hypothetical protein [Dyadobacter psychrotolerans]TDE14421.1 hypothetical protein E0F88_14565 [Dyadobacter psychrotolerans]
MEIPGLSIIPVLFVVLIIVPGVFAKRFYFSGVFAKRFGAGDFADRLITSIFWGFIVQVITYLVYSQYFDFTLLDIKEYLVVAYSDLSSNKLPRDFEKYNLWMVLGYVIASIGMSALVGGWIGWIPIGQSFKNRYQIQHFPIF